jgi:hypothetical protein
MFTLFQGGFVHVVPGRNTPLLLSVLKLEYAKQRNRLMFFGKCLKNRWYRVSLDG